MNTADQQYCSLLAKLLDQVEPNNKRNDRTGTGTYSIFGHQMRFNLNEGFPLLTTKKVHFPSIVSELLWFLKGDTNIEYLLKHNNHIWTDWRYKNYLKSIGLANSPDHPMYISMGVFEKRIVENKNFALMWGDIGKGYGHQWRNFGEVQLNDCDSDLSECMNQEAKSRSDVVKSGFDQISWVINEIKTNPYSRRLIVSGWNPHEVAQVDLPPCHTLFQFFVQDLTFEERYKLLETKAIEENLIFSARMRSNEEWLEVCDTHNIPKAKLSCQLYQRSADTFLGVPFNIASYALLTHIVAKECGMAVGDFVWTGGDVHLYSNHIDQAQLQLSRLEQAYLLPTIKLNYSDKSIYDLEPNDIELVGYFPHLAIKAEVAV